MKDYIYRMEDERDCLITKLSKLKRFLEKDGAILDDTERYFMQKQAKVMSEYLDILDSRFNYAVLKEQYNALKEQKEDEK